MRTPRVSATPAAAVLCRAGVARVTAVALALASCGGTVASAVDGGASDGSTPAHDGCPSVAAALCTGSQDAGVADTGAAPDARVCMTVDPTSYDQTCTADPDCVAAGGGTFCSGEPWCMCAGDTINVVDQARYKQAIDEVIVRLAPGPGGCSCPYFGSPRCVQKHCRLCGGPGGGAPGCPDGG